MIRQLVSGWADRTGHFPAVVVEDGIDDLDPETSRHLLTALSQILATAARHETGPFRVSIAAEDGRAIVTADGEDWPHVARSEFGRMSTLVRDDGGSLEIDTTHPVLTRVTWRSA